MQSRVGKRIFACVLLGILLFGSIRFPLDVQADGAVLVIRNLDDWVMFAKNCRTDTYSKDLQVELRTELDLTGVKDLVVPVFNGSFNGGGHSIKGIVLEASTDTFGLFRVIGPDALVSNLKVSGIVRTDEKRTVTGLLCGENRGKIKNCSVYGMLTGYEYVGAAAGKNNGVLRNVQSYAEVRGTSQTGGVAGWNDGTIADSGNHGAVNPDANESSVNIGGVVGKNEGKVLRCFNEGEIGYLHTGYNVGGIIGLHRGYMEHCTNTADVVGRRDVGGTAGQMEPSFRVEYGKNALKLLNNSVSGFSDNLNQATAVLEDAFNQGASGLNAVVGRITGFASGFSNNVSGLFSQMTWIGDAQGYIEAIRTELTIIKESIPGRTDVAELIAQIEKVLEAFEEEDPSAWEQQLQILMGLLGRLVEKIGNISKIGENISNIGSYFRALSETVIGGIQNFGTSSTAILEETVTELSGIQGMVKGFLSDTSQNIGTVRGSISNALNSLSNLQASVEKVLKGKEVSTKNLSSQIGARDNGMIVSCGNSGAVSADYNTGGILGNLSLELSSDQEEDALPSVDDMLFADTAIFVRATVYDCINQGDVSAKYDYTGGIIGFGTRGTVFSCKNNGNISAERDYAGGIAGYFRGTLKSDYSISSVAGLSYVGGIAGHGKYAVRCRTIPVVKAKGANVGAVAGTLDDGKKNLFVNKSLGGVNGIDYAKITKKISYRRMTNLKNTPDMFKTMEVVFLVDGEPVKTERVSYGEACPQPPQVEYRDGQYWKWDKTEEKVYHSRTVSGKWEKLITTIATDEETPSFLAEGIFDDRALLTAELLEQGSVSAPLSDANRAYCSFRVSVENSDAEMLTVRFLHLTDGNIYDVSDGKPVLIESKRDGKYLVFQLANGGSFEYIESYNMDKLNRIRMIFMLARLALVLAAVIGIAALTITDKRKSKKQAEADAGEAEAESLEEETEAPENVEEEPFEEAEETPEDVEEEPCEDLEEAPKEAEEESLEEETEAPAEAETEPLEEAEEASEEAEDEPFEEAEEASEEVEEEPCEDTSEDQEKTDYTKSE